MSTQVPDLKESEIAFETVKQFKHRFPPFPSVPEGVIIVPFKDFKENGIQIFEGEDEVERDGLGIPTVPLRVKHDTDISKTNPDRAKKREMRGTFRKEWWQDWEEGEDLRNHGPYDILLTRSSVMLPPVDRFHQAASDFQRYRKVPPIISNCAGLLGTTPVWQKASEKEAEDGAVSDDEFDDEDSSRGPFGRVDLVKGGTRNCGPRAPYDLYGKAPTIVEDNEDIVKLLDTARATKEDKVVAFLDNPARAIQYAADRNLVSTPHLLRFFVNYMLRNKVLPDKTTERSLKNALEIIDAAAKQLPLTSELAKKLPDHVSVAAQSCWGARGDTLDAWIPEEPDNVFESILKEENIEVIKPEDVLLSANAPDGENDSHIPTSDAATDTFDPCSFADSWDQTATTAPYLKQTLLSLLGPTALPLTHTPGIVEWSVRRIKSVVLPVEAKSPNTVAGAGAGEWEEWAAEAVERELEGRFARVVMTPWVEWDGPENLPRIMRSSPAVTAASPAPAPAPSLGPGGLKPHDPLTDDITLLMEPAVAETLVLNMGLGGTWVQLARLRDLAAPVPIAEAEGAEAHTQQKNSKKKSLTKAQKARRGLRYWYLDDHMMVLPSYWLV
ncbi:hypothetical protein B0H14DRAFT_2851108 [Mycena olivaceomarginata]|nr:hypothetical protein B0H14DRAFT_2851108 [Mycena olivaceomarginata]